MSIESTSIELAVSKLATNSQFCHPCFQTTGLPGRTYYVPEICKFVATEDFKDPDFSFNYNIKQKSKFRSIIVDNAKRHFTHQPHKEKQSKKLIELSPIQNDVKVKLTGLGSAYFVPESNKVVSTKDFKDPDFSFNCNITHQPRNEKQSKKLIRLLPIQKDEKLQQYNAGSLNRNYQTPSIWFQQMIDESNKHFRTTNRSASKCKPSNDVTGFPEFR